MKKQDLSIIKSLKTSHILSDPIQTHHLGIRLSSDAQKSSNTFYS